LVIIWCYFDKNFGNKFGCVMIFGIDFDIDLDNMFGNKFGNDLDNNINNMFGDNVLILLVMQKFTFRTIQVQISN
jgi:hypothetical protein